MKFKHLFSAAAITLALSFGFTSCSSDDDDYVPIDPVTKLNKDLSKDSKTENTIGTIVGNDNGVVQLRNFRQVVKNDKEEEIESPLFYFDFINHDAGTEEQHNISLAAPSSMAITANLEAGYTLSYIDKDFKDVKADDQFTPLKSEVKDKEGNTKTVSQSGLRDMLINGTPRRLDEFGWCDYIFTENNKETHRVIAIENRTLILVKDSKPLVKFKVNNIYENEKPNKEEKPDNYRFYSIDYQAL
ncbi:hypothetical protein ORI89_09100 [Sphingobacterium sp. UT-1RO-CII-1]|uniref:hypothetical protein n=1 Tax=Sphingobacterium sp. UT-1RO-CII-1 TaxID=2995225 RepID=UPI00227BDAC2|nr:hypothetical protein [Sphingobacterium sp. UT-1RO-CII-1]MCY4779808.1 hypothetical protein [Sphingobacterium sp. UT-1RO-CII-1]